MKRKIITRNYKGNNVNKVTSSIINKIKNYCHGTWKPCKKEEELFLSSVSLKNTTGNKQSMNTGKLSEWYIHHVLKTKGIHFKNQPKIKFVYNKKIRYIQPDFYIPHKNLFIEVKSRSYNCSGTASEKLDHIVRKYSKLDLSDEYKNSKLLVVCSASEIFQESTNEILSYKNKSTRSYIKEFVQLSKKHNILDWIPISKINSYI
jgi:hypothetical protein